MVFCQLMEVGTSTENSRRATRRAPTGATRSRAVPTPPARRSEAGLALAAGVRGVRSDLPVAKKSRARLRKKKKNPRDPFTRGEPRAAPDPVRPSSLVPALTCPAACGAPSSPAPTRGSSAQSRAAPSCTGPCAGDSALRGRTGAARPAPRLIHTGQNGDPPPAGRSDAPSTTEVPTFRHPLLPQ